MNQKTRLGALRCQIKGCAERIAFDPLQSKWVHTRTNKAECEVKTPPMATPPKEWLA